MCATAHKLIIKSAITLKKLEISLSFDVFGNIWNNVSTEVNIFIKVVFRYLEEEMLCIKE